MTMTIETPPLSDLARAYPALAALLGWDTPAEDTPSNPARTVLRVADPPPPEPTPEPSAAVGAPASLPRVQGASLASALRPEDSLALIPVGAPVVTILSDVEPEEVSWLWPDRIARGKLTLIIGDPGLGKSYLTLDLAARVSTASEWPDGGKAPLGNVLLLSAEDGAADTIRPRFDLVGGDSKRVGLFEGIKERDGVRPVSLVEDLRRLGPLFEVGDFSLMVIDPLSAYLGKTDSFRDSEVRALLAPLAALAEKRGISVVAVMHLTKDSDRKAIYRGLGSIAFVGAARAVYAVAADPNNDGRRLFLPIKFNLGVAPPSLAFRITDSGLEWAREPVTVDVEEVLRGLVPPARRPAPRRDEADTFLREVLAVGPVDVAEIREAADRRGLAWPTIERA